MAFKLATEVSREFHLSLAERDAAWVLRCAGILDSADAAAKLQPELLKLHQAVLAAGVQRVEVEVQEIEYMNSSALKSFMVWFLAAANDAPGRYVIELRFDPARSWQHMSFRPMERLAPNTVTLVGLPLDPGTVV